MANTPHFRLQEFADSCTILASFGESSVVPPQTSNCINFTAMSNLPFKALPQTKVCGITRASDLRNLSANGVDAVGLNLVPSSKRHVSLAKATELAVQARELGLTTVAVVMDPTKAALLEICKAFAWDFVQLHGTEKPAIADACGDIAIIKASGWSGRPDEELLLKNWSQAFWADRNTPEGSVGKKTLAGFLLDAYAPNQGGGTGQLARWDLIYPRTGVLQGWPIMLAGGLTADNVAAAIQATRCDGVDTASGVESAPGIKSADKVRRYAAEAQLGFDSIR